MTGFKWSDLLEKNMKRYNVVILFFILACNRNEVLLNSLFLKNSLYVETGAATTFSGVAISKFESGRTSSKITFVDGVPFGDWSAYDYEGDIV